MIEYTIGKGKSITQPLYSKKHFNEKFEFDTLAITCYRANEAVAKLKLEQKWSAKESSLSMRKALMFEKYPEYRKQPINKKLILFESTWGTKYNCNPQAIYEYINKNYPQYECIWSLNDARTPINGRAKRVRRGSQEYYKALAAAKYLINNVNFEDDYVKRKGQIEVQTMHGTPYKTFGLDVADEMSDPDRRERFLKRTSRWDYLVVQGEFMNSMAYRMFHYNKKILKTGYPRTDVLFSDIDTEKIKKQLGIPLDKKVILYTPTWRVKKKFDVQLDITKMKELLGGEYVLLTRVHYLSAEKYDVSADGEFSFDVTSYKDVQELYKISDMLITDYSSVMFDYALLNKPMIFFTYDLDSYSGATRGVYFDIRKEAPGPIVYTCDELINAVANIDSEMKKVGKRADTFKKKYLTYENPNSAKMVVDKVLRPSKIETYFARKSRQRNK